ncbi:glycoside hydrolase family 2 sugar binding protein [Rhodopirellula sallentina SM41]|uniref:Glycoside hydrolase family 2 sugar binding protein n=1 Tax=Rhodopirellula sallentina SM41 TaxID=1263870 RepID=M5UMQ3_9BACT|nr:glycoside hydrolase family 2 sugar binding protein [Rhodopirellula sallentina SM41]
MFLALLSVFFVDVELVSAETEDASFGVRKYNLNIGWRFIRDDVEGAHQSEFDDQNWDIVSCPHTWNDVDTFNDFGTGGHQGETDLWQGAAWYRKEFSLPESAVGKRVIVEFEGVRQVADVYINGHHLGQDKTGFIPFGFDLTPHLEENGTNVLAVKADNTVEPTLYTGATPWHHQNWHPPHGGIYRNVYLHVLDPVHVTLPLYGNLGSEGVYVWTDSLTKSSASVGAIAQIGNSQSSPVEANITFSIIDREREIVASASEVASIDANGLCKVDCSLDVSDPHLWEPDYPYLYELNVEVTVDGVVRDISSVPVGIRNFRFDKNSGFWINGRHLKLHGWGQKPIAGWAGLGAGIPNWMHDYTLRMMEDAGGNLIRWGHCAGPPVGVESSDKYGFVTIMPGVDGEKDCQGDAWQTRTNAYRDMIVYYRNHPAICIWEGGNYSVSPEHAAELKEIVQKWDPKGKRYFGFRMSTPAMRESIDIELGTVGRTRTFPSLAVVETEYDRTETPRRVWDEYSPPDFGRLGKLEELNTYSLTSEGFATNAIDQWWTLFGSKPGHSGGANWIFSDGTHGTRQRTDCARATGEVDGVRLPKEAYWALQATWDDEDRVHLIGHWTYPATTVKNMYAVAKADRAELFVNGKSLGVGERSFDTLFTWPDVVYEPGEITVVAYRDGLKIATQTKHTAGQPHAIRLTPITSPAGWRADGSDVVLVDFEVVDQKGRRCPVDQARVDFAISGPGIWRGGYNSGVEDSTNKKHLMTECGINRVSIRSTLQPGEVTLTASRDGLHPAVIHLTSKPVEVVDGLSETLPSVLGTSLPDRPYVDAERIAELEALRAVPVPAREEANLDDQMFSMFAYTGEGAGGQETQYQHEMLPYSDEARIYIKEAPSYLHESRVIRTAKNDSDYWANDYIVASAAREMEFFVAHDVKAPVPEWLSSYRKTGDKVKLNRGTLALYVKRLAKDEAIKISGNADQAKGKGSHLNMILFCKPVSSD